MTSGPPPLNDETGVALADGVTIPLLWDGDGEPEAEPASVAEGTREACVDETQPEHVTITIRSAETAVRVGCIDGIVRPNPDSSREPVLVRERIRESGRDQAARD